MKNKNNTANKTASNPKTTKLNKSIVVEKQTATGKVSHEMAVYFEDHVTASKLVRWITTVSQTERICPCGEIDDFIANIGWSFLPELINCKDAKSRFKFLESSLVHVFSICGYTGAKTALCEIGRNYLKEVETISNDSKEVGEFMSVYSAFLTLMTLYCDYEFLSNSERESIAA